MELKDLRPTRGSVKRRKRIGRGHGSGHGGHASGRGTKGQNARSGRGTRLGYEGGQTPLWMRFPKRGFHNYTRTEYSIINVDILAERFESGAEITLERLREMGIIRQPQRRLKVLGRGELSKSLIVKADQFTKTAQAKIEQAGGRAEVL
ncbi:50S ribosomal protein L15 [Candidatus Acetothermia bacterium]|nr:50S ribosomal protein L15 [Candidatus Acetothermia bacterium]MCI2426399.1 50S ribosomal protein L15 [Candidatus Acetothermia bacterium]MCI2427593.1 50S ribosomal protein L15 [Candidatus Acetothermia bacterium]MCI2428205.1 50S ribosomal protein L15 [Candidatus Acetothermia bacterium]